MQIKTDKIKFQVGVIVGRFQVNDLHPGHIELLDWVKSNHDTMIVLLGCSPVISRNNPLSYNVRRLMIQKSYPDAIILPVNDTRDDESWSQSVDTTIRRVVRPNEKVCLYGSRDSFVKHYTGSYPTNELEGTGHFWSGSEVRERIANKSLDSSDFRAGIVFATHADYPRVIPTVDMVVEDSDGVHIYMIRKNGETSIRFPGGYCEPGSTWEQTARREIREEIGDVETDEPKYVGNLTVDDWRYRSNPDKIQTTVFHTKVLWGKVGNFSDRTEIAEVVPVTKTNLALGYLNSVVPEHHAIVELLIKRGILPSNT